MIEQPVLKRPFPYFGGKAKVAPIIWSRFGDVVNYVEPFFGSGAVLLARPQPFSGTETVNDADGLLCNFWRALQSDPEQVAHYADWPVSECDLHARHIWLVERKESMQTRLEGDPDWYDAKAAGWWVWGIACWIAGGWCAGNGPWHVVDGELVKGDAGRGVKRQRPHLGDAGHGVNRKRPHLGTAGRGVKRQLPHLGNAGQGVNRQLPRLGGFAETGANAQDDLYGYMQALSDRLRRVRVCCGDWSRVCGPTPTFGQGLTAVFLDPPYSHAVRDKDLYSVETDCSAAVREWAIANGDNPLMRICLAGYATEHDMPESWECYAWAQHAGYGVQATERTGNGKLERLWFSPHCIKPTPAAPTLF